MAILTGSPNDDLIIGTLTSDQIEGNDGNDMIDGSRGDDFLNGGLGNDTYIFRPGDGHDVINEAFTGGGFDTIRLYQFAPANILLQRVNNDLVIQSTSGTDSITVQSYFDPNLPNAKIEQIMFYDGTIWDTNAINTRIMTNNQSTVSPFNDVIVAQGFGVVIDGMEGDDIISGTTGDDTLIGGAGNDKLYGFAGNDTLIGGDGNDTLLGYAGNDILDGGTGNDTYIFSASFANEQIYDASGFDTIKFQSSGLDINDQPTNQMMPQDLRFIQNGNDLILVNALTSGQITVHNNFGPPNPLDPFGPPTSAIDQIVFEDGTVWGMSEIMTRMINGYSNQPTPGNDVLIGTAGNDFIVGYGGNDTMSGGDGNDQIIGDWGNDRLFGNAGDDFILGNGGDDQLWGNTGNDLLDGGWGNDTYYFNFGDGHDTINEINPGENNRIVFGEGIGIDNIKLRQDSNGVVIDIVGSGDSLTITNESLNIGSPHLINQLVFADGTVTTLDKLLAVQIGTPFNDWMYGTPIDDTMLGLGGDDTLVGFEGNDVLNGGTGNDILVGGQGNDTYVYQAGDGLDRISRDEFYQPIEPNAVKGIDTLQLGAGIDPSMLNLQQWGADLAINFATSSTDQIMVEGYFDPLQSDKGLEQITFADGTVWNAEAISNRVLQNNANWPTPLGDTIVGSAGFDIINGLDGNDTISGGAGDDQITGDNGNDRLFGNAGNDSLIGNAGNDLIVGGTGNDFLAGESGSDTYQFKVGDGVDTIIDYDQFGISTDSNTDTIQLGEGYDAATVQLQRIGDDLVISQFGSSDQITVQQHFTQDWDGSRHTAIEQIQFADGTIWDLAAITARVLNGNGNWTTPQDDTIAGTVLNDFISGSDGNDTISGGGGDDQITGDSGNDRLFGNDGNDLLLGGEGNDQLAGNRGNDILDGGAGNDTYYFNLGDGQDVINEDPLMGGSNTLVLGDRIGIENLRLTQQGPDLLIEIIGSGAPGMLDSVRLTNTSVDPAQPQTISQVQFADGSTYTLAQLQSAILGTPTNDWIFGTPTADVIVGIAGDDTLVGLEGNDVLNGGTGNDILVGGQGDDTYVYQVGDGLDRISRDQFYQPIEPNAVKGIDTLQLGAGIDPSTVILQQWGTDLAIEFTTNSGDQIIVEGYFDFLQSDKGIEKITFADGTVWNAESISNLLLQHNTNWSTPLGDTIVGSASNDVITGMDGNDTISGGVGDDQITGDNGNDRLFGNAGNDSLIGSAGNDLLVGGTGNDFLAGESGSDTYQFKVGDGMDTIIDVDQFGNPADSNNTDTIQLGDGYDASSVQLKRIGDDLVISQFGSSDQITVQQHFLTDFTGATHNAIEQIQFADGTIWDSAAITARVLNGNGNWTTPQDDTIAGTVLNDFISGSDGNDTISGGGGDDQITGDSGNDRLFGNDGNDLILGGDGNDQLSGNRGNDILDGGAGNDTYYFNLGDGQDVINEAPLMGGSNTLVLGERIGIENLRLTQQGPDLLIEIIGSGAPGMLDSVRLTNTSFDPAQPQAISQVQFADGSTYTLAQLQSAIIGTPTNDWIFGTPTADVIVGIAGDDTLVGLEGNDVLNGGTGNDILVGGQGDDTYVYQAGDGLDRISRDQFYQPIEPNSVKGIDTLQLGTGIDPSTVILQQWGVDLAINFSNSPTDQIIVEGYLESYFDPQRRDRGIEQISFADGTVWNAEAINNRVLQNNANWSTPLGDTIVGSAGNDAINGMDGNDTISGGAGDDQITGDNGNDRLFGNAGNDSLIGNAGNDLLVGGTGNDFLAGESGSDTYQFKVGDGMDTIIDVDQFGNPTDSNVDTIQLGEGYDASSVQLQRIGDDLVISQFGGSDQITVQQHFTQDWVGSRHNAIEQIQFTDGTIWDSNAITARVVNGNGNWTTPQDDTIAGTVLNDFISGSDGNDTISGGGGDDQINGDSGNDRLFGNDGNDLILGGDGNDQLSGNRGNDILDGGAGNDTYYFNLGDGQDVINEAPLLGGSNTLVLGERIGIENLRLTQQGPDLLIEIIGSGAPGMLDSVRLTNTSFDPAQPQAISQVQFADGATYTLAQLQNIIVGTNSVDWLSGTSGNDTIVGFDGPDHLIGGQGNDALNGGAGSDIYVFNMGDGQDIIIDHDSSPYSLDTVELGPNITQAIMSPGRMGNDLVVDFTSGDRITVKDWYSSPDNQIESWHFADGTMLTAAQLQAWADNLSPQVAQPIAALTIQEDVPFTFTIPANTFVDPNAGDTLTYTASLSNGQSLPTWLVFDVNTGTFIGTPGNNDVGDLNVRVFATDNYGMTAVNDFALTVLNVNDAPVLVNPLANANGAEGTAFSYNVPANTFADVDVGDTLTYSAMLSDGSALPSWLNFNTTTQTLSGTLVDGNAGVYSIRITATDTAGTSAFSDFTLTVADTLATTFTGTSASDVINGTAFMDVINGGGGNDTLYGFAGNDTLNGGSGSDMMYGGSGDDTYIVNSSGDVVIENVNEGIDTVQSSASYSLASNVENLTLTGSSNNSATGNELDNVLIGNSGRNTLIGGAGNDWLDGGAGSDTMLGGTGNDTYVVSSSGDVVTENANEGIDTVRTSISYTLGSNVENLTLTGAGNISGTGNSLDNGIIGNNASNTLTGNAGNDILQGLGGNDTLRGGTGNDTYLFGRGDGNDTIVENDATAGNVDTVSFSVNPLDLVLTQSGSNLIVSLHGGTDTMTVQNWYSGTQYQTEVITASDGSLLQSTQVDQLIQAMASYSASHGGISWDQAIDQNPNDVQAIVAAYWQPPAAG